MYRAVPAVLQRYYGADTVVGNEMSVHDAVESANQEWSLQTDQGLAVWSARQSHWRY